MTEWTSPKPLPIPLAMSTKMPESPKAESGTSTAEATATATATSTATASKVPENEHEKPKEPSKDKPSYLPTPKLRFEIRDLEHSGAVKFQDEISAGKALKDAIETVITILYDTTKKIHHPAVRSITFVLKSMGGVAYTTGNELDDEHKEIHLSLEYIDGQSDNRLRHEILGVIVHEMVHVWQWNALGSYPGGLIEGIADYVRLKAGYAPPHWTRVPAHDWDAGYEKTAFFLEWLEDVYGNGKVVELNGLLRHDEYNDKIWKQLFGHSVDDLFKAYKKEYEKRQQLKNSKDDV